MSAQKLCPAAPCLQALICPEIPSRQWRSQKYADPVHSAAGQLLGPRVLHATPANLTGMLINQSYVVRSFCDNIVDFYHLLQQLQLLVYLFDRRVKVCISPMGPVWWSWWSWWSWKVDSAAAESKWVGRRSWVGPISSSGFWVYSTVYLWSGLEVLSRRAHLAPSWRAGLWRHGWNLLAFTLRHSLGALPGGLPYVIRRRASWRVVSSWPSASFFSSLLVLNHTVDSHSSSGHFDVHALRGRCSLVVLRGRFRLFRLLAATVTGACGAELYSARGAVKNRSYPPF